MKKVLFILFLLGMVIPGMIFADDYVVNRASGRVEWEASPGNWKALTPGAVLSSSAVVNIGLNSVLVLQSGEQVITLRAMQNGAIEKLVAANTAGGIRIGGRIATTGGSASTRAAVNISTASTRASDANEDFEWAEE